MSGSIKHIVMGRSAAALSFIMFAENHIQWQHQSTAWQHPSTRFACNNSPLSAAFHASPWKTFFQQAGNFSRIVRNSLLIPILFTFLYFFPSHIISIISLFLLSLIFFGSIFYSWKASWADGSKKITN